MGMVKCSAELPQDGIDEMQGEGDRLLSGPRAAIAGFGDIKTEDAGLVAPPSLSEPFCSSPQAQRGAATPASAVGCRTIPNVQDGIDTSSSSSSLGVRNQSAR